MRPEDENVLYTSIENPEWLDERCDAIVCSVKFSHRPVAEDFVARPDDIMPHGREIFRRCHSGEFGWLMPASKDRVDKLYRAAEATEQQFFIGDIHSNSKDEELQIYIERHNRENRSGSETGIVIALGSILDHVLGRLLKASNVSKKLSFQEKIARAHELGIITERESANLNLVRQIRNAFGHEHQISLSDEPLRGMCEKLYEDVIGDGGTPSLRLRFSSASFGLMADILSRLEPTSEIDRTSELVV